MKCIKCSAAIPDESVYCMFCGKKQITLKKEKARSRAGQGSVTFHKSSGKYYARLTLNRQRMDLGYFKSETEAWAAVRKAQRELVSPVTGYNWTVADVYERWHVIHYEKLSKDSVNNYVSAWRYLAPIAGIKMRDVKTSHFQQCIDTAASLYGRPICEKIRSLSSLLCRFAMKDDIISKNYALLVELPPASSEGHLPFTDEEIAALLRNTTDDTVKVILMLIYTGLRPGELFSITLNNVDLELGFIRGGSKTEAGRNRIVPIHSRVMPFFRHFYEEAVAMDSPWLIHNEAGNRFDINNWRRRRFYPVLEKTGILSGPDDRHLTPYSCRHTFATLCDRAGINDNLIVKMVGHTSKKTTDKFYIHKTEQDLAQAIEAI